MDTQHTRRSVVVGIDGSESALHAVRWGADEAARRRLPLRLVIAFAWRTVQDLGHPGLGNRVREVMLGTTRRHLAAAAAVARQRAPEVETEQQLIAGYPIPVLVAETGLAEVLVIGDRGMSRLEGLLVGSVAVAVAAQAAGPVVVVRGTDSEPSETAARPVVVGVAGSPAGEAAIAFAFDAAATRHVPLVAVHTFWDLIVDPMMATMVDWNAVGADEQRRLLSERLAGWAEKYPDVPVELVVTRDSPAHSLVTQAAGAQLLVVGSRGRGEFAGLVLGSVSHAVLHRAPCPVAVVRVDATSQA